MFTISSSSMLNNDKIVSVVTPLANVVIVPGPITVRQSLAYILSVTLNMECGGRNTQSMPPDIRLIESDTYKLVDEDVESNCSTH